MRYKCMRYIKDKKFFLNLRIVVYIRYVREDKIWRQKKNIVFFQDYIYCRKKRRQYNYQGNFYCSRTNKPFNYISLKNNKW